MDILRAVTDRLRPQPGMSGDRWAQQLDRAVDRVLDHCVTLDPDSDGPRRVTPMAGRCGSNPSQRR
jgi:hypothetical protein